MTTYIALIISGISLCLSFYAIFRDRKKFEVIGIYQDSPGNIFDQLYFRIVNTGRRPITPYELIFHFSDGSMKNIRIKTELHFPAVDGNLYVNSSYPCLSESQFFEFRLNKQNLDWEQYHFENLEIIEINDSIGEKIRLKPLAKEIREKAQFLQGDV